MLKDNKEEGSSEVMGVLTHQAGFCGSVLGEKGLVFLFFVFFSDKRFNLLKSYLS